MALITRARQGLLRLHLLERMLGLTGLLVAGAGLLLASWNLDLVSATDWRAALTEFFAGGVLDPVRKWGLALLLAGGLVAILALMVEVIVVLRVAAGRRGAFGGNVALQILLAAVLLVGINIFSFSHYHRYDWTRFSSLALV